MSKKASTLRLSPVGLVATLTLAFLVASLAASAQPQKNIPLIGVLRPGYPPSPDHPNDGFNAFRQSLRDLGYVEGQTILLEVRFADYGVPGATTGFFAVSRVSRQVPWTMVFAFRQ